MKKDFNDVFAMYKDDLEEASGTPKDDKDDEDKDDAEYTSSETHASLAHASEGTAALKAAIIAKTKQFAEAMESLNMEDVDAMKKDFNDAFAMYKDDLKAASG